MGSYADSVDKMLFSSGIKQSAESFCWAYDGSANELKINKVWIRVK